MDLVFTVLFLLLVIKQTKIGSLFSIAAHLIVLLLCIDNFAILCLLLMLHRISPHPTHPKSRYSFWVTVKADFCKASSPTAAPRDTRLAFEIRLGQLMLFICDRAVYGPLNISSSCYSSLYCKFMFQKLV